MKVKNSISPEIISAAVGILQVYVPELTPTRLIGALQDYNSDNKEQEIINARPRQPYTIQEVCKLLRISKPTVYRLAQKGKIKLLKIGSSTRICAEEVDRLLGN